MCWIQVTSLPHVNLLCTGCLATDCDKWNVLAGCFEFAGSKHHAGKFWPG
jgi:hypothetical protein